MLALTAHDGRDWSYPDSVTIHVAEDPGSPANQLADLRQFIVDQAASGHIDPELEQPLTTKVDSAIDALARGNPNAAKVAMNDLKALIKQVQAQTDKKIEAATAAEIIERADHIIAQLGG